MCTHLPLPPPFHSFCPFLNHTASPIKVTCVPFLKCFFLHVSYTHTWCSAVYAVPCFARGCYLHLLSCNRVNCACREGKKRRKERGGKIIITYTHRIKVKRAVLLSLSVRVCGVAVLDSSRQRNSKYTARTWWCDFTLLLFKIYILIVNPNPHKHPNILTLHVKRRTWTQRSRRQ